MAGREISSEGLDGRRRRLLFRSLASRHSRDGSGARPLCRRRTSPTLSDAELDEYERWLEIPDQQIFAWVNGAEAAPAEIDSALFRRLRDFHLDGGADVMAMAKSPAELLRAGQAADAGAGRRRRRRAGARRSCARGRGAAGRAGDFALPSSAATASAWRSLSRALAFFGPDIRDAGIPGLGLPALRPRLAQCRRGGAAHDRAVAAGARRRAATSPSVLLTTVNAALQRVPAREFVATHALSVAPGNVIGMAGIIEWLELNGFTRASTVREPGEYAVRGGILDLFPPGMDDAGAARFLRRRAGDDPQLRRADAAQRDAICAGSIWCRSPNSSSSPRPSAASAPAMSRNSAPPRPDDLLYEAVSEGRRYPGMEHWLPLFHDQLETLFDYLPGTPLALEPLAEDAARERFAQIADYYEARRAGARRDGR